MSLRVRIKTFKGHPSICKEVSIDQGFIKIYVSVACWSSHMAGDLRVRDLTQASPATFDPGLQQKFTKI